MRVISEQEQTGRDETKRKKREKKDKNRKEQTTWVQIIPE